MSRVVNQNWITFGGEPVTGRTPPNLTVFGPEMTKEQYGAVAHAYKLFTDVCNISLAKYQVANRTFADGTKVRMTSNLGVDRVMVYTPGGDEDLFAGFFMGVASSEINKQGATEVKPSALWGSYPQKPMPEKVTPKRTLDEHPGHVAWTGKNFKHRGSEVVLSWRGPSDRYALTTGFNGQGVVVTHALRDQDPDLFKDYSDVWFNGVRADTGILKVIAAALHRPDPNTPELVVLRVCSDNYPQASLSRRVVVYDLVPQGTNGADGVSLAAIVGATRFETIATYVADNYQVQAYGPGQWSFLQRPHFNNDGSKIASIALIYGATIATNDSVQTVPGTYAASFDPETWEILERVATPSGSTHTETVVTTREIDPVTREFLGSSYSRNLTQRTHSSRIGAVDFLDDVLVYFTVDTIESGSSTDSSTLSGGPGYISEGSFSSSYTTDVSIRHSVYGVLVSYSGIQNASGSGSGQFAGEIGFGSDDGVVNKLVSFVGDLSKNIYAFGWSAQKTYSVSGSGGPLPQNSSGGYSMHVLGTLIVPDIRLNYDVFVGSRKLYSGNTGHAVFPPSTQTFPQAIYAYSIMATKVFFDGDTGYVSTGVFAFSNSETYQRQTPAYLNVAVAPMQLGAYLGISHAAYGLEISIRKSKSVGGTDSFVVEEVPAYVPGVLPTISAPIFINYSGKTPL